MEKEKKKKSATVDSDPQDVPKKVLPKKKKEIETETPENSPQPKNDRNVAFQTDFEAGVLFNKYDSSKGGSLTADDFRKMWYEQKAQRSQAQASIPDRLLLSSLDRLQTQPEGNISSQYPLPPLDGRNYPLSHHFAGYNLNPQQTTSSSLQPSGYSSGYSPVSFPTYSTSHPSLLPTPSTSVFPPQSNTNLPSHLSTSLFPSHHQSPPSLPSFQPPPPPPPLSLLYTHFDETSSIPLTASSLSTHLSLGHSILPLSESYQKRYTFLHTHLISRLLPRKEQLKHCQSTLNYVSNEMTMKRKAIEKETIQDCEQILERLRGVESMRQSSLNHELLQVEEELLAIDRVVERVERAHTQLQLQQQIREQEKLKTNDPTYSSSSSTSSSSSSSLGFNPIYMQKLESPSSGYSSSSSSSSSSTFGSGSGIGGVGGEKKMKPEEELKTSQMMIELIQQTQELSSCIDYLSKKNISIQLDFPMNDFPKETSERLEILSKCDKYIQAIDFKDQLLWNILQERNILKEKLTIEQDLSISYHEELTQWVECSNQCMKKYQREKSRKELYMRRNEELMDVLRRHNIYYVLPQEEREEEEEGEEVEEEEAEENEREEVQEEEEERELGVEERDFDYYQ